MKGSAIRQMTKLAASAGKDLITFAGGMPNPATFPLDRLAAIASREILNHQGRNLQYGMTIGMRRLIQWICNYMGSKQIDASPENVICTTGSQQALDLIHEVIIDPGDFIFVETPTYLGALAVFQKGAGVIVPVQQDPHGMVLEDLEEKLASTNLESKKLIYLISNFQNPSGISLEEKRRDRLPGLLEKYNAYLIEDDPYGEIYFGQENKPCATVKSRASNRIFYLGTFSKLVAPTFRTGWVVAPESHARKLELAKEAADLCGSMLDQRILYDFCSSSDFQLHLEKLRSFYDERRRAMQDALQQYMPSSVSWTQPTGGFFIWLTLPAHLDAESFLEEAILKEMVSFVIGRPFTCDGSGSNCLRLAFSVEEPNRIYEGISRLASIIQRHL